MWWLTRSACGSKKQSIARRANALWKQRLADYEAPPLDPTVEEALKAFIAERKAVLPDSFA